MVEPITLQDMSDITKVNDNFEDVQDQIDNIDLEISNINGRVTNEIARATGVEEILTTQVNNHSLQIATNALNIETKQGTLTAGTGITIDSNNVISASGGGGGGDDLLVEVTYSELKTMRDGLQLVPGQQYRITDFTTIINGNVTVSGTTKTLYRSANHPFDIIVTADSSNTLNENARAIQHSGDTYFASQNLKAWQLKYCIDNNTTRFNWASSSGKGVIYYMKDERENECGYDFKNIQMKRFKITAVDLTSLDWAGLGTLNTKYKTNCIDYLVGTYLGTIKASDLLPIRNDIITINESDYKWIYTFNRTTDNFATCKDNSLSYTRHCVIKNTSNRLNNTAFVGQSNSTIGVYISGDNWDNTFGNYTFGVNIDFGFQNNIIGNSCYLNSIKENFKNNIMIDSCKHNFINVNNNNNIMLYSSVQTVYGVDVNNCILSMNNAFIGNAVSYVQSGEDCDDWNIGNECHHIITGDQCERLYLVPICSYLNITNNNVRVLVNKSGSAGNLLSIPDFNGQTIVGDSYYTANYSTAGRITGITEYYKSHRGTVIANDNTGVAPTNLQIGYTLETYETA